MSSGPFTAPPYLTWPEFRFSMRATEDWAGVTATRLEPRRTEICSARAIGNLADVVVAVAPLEDISTPPRSNGSEGRKSQTREEAVRSNRSRVWNLMDDPTSTCTLHTKYMVRYQICGQVFYMVNSLVVAIGLGNVINIQSNFDRQNPGPEVGKFLDKNNLCATFW